MTMAEEVVQKLQALPAEKQRQVLEFIDQLQATKRPALIDPRGMFAGSDTTEEDIAEVRREMWADSPGEDF